MKRILTTALCVCLATVFASSAQIRVGLDGGYVVNSNTEENVDFSGTLKNSNQSMLLIPYFSYFLNDMVELSVGLPIGFTRVYSENDPEVGETRERLESAFRIGGRVGSYFHMIRLDHFHLAVGPEIDFIASMEPTTELDGEEAESNLDSYSNITFAVNLPVKMDFLITENVGLRLGLDVLGFSLNSVSETPEGEGAEEETEKTSGFNFITGPEASLSESMLGKIAPSVGLFVQF